jgi:hypothetical protein
MLSGMTLDVTRRLSHKAGFDGCFDKTARAKMLHALLQTPRR